MIISGVGVSLLLGGVGEGLLLGDVGVTDTLLIGGVGVTLLIGGLAVTLLVGGSLVGLFLNGRLLVGVSSSLTEASSTVPTTEGLGLGTFGTYLGLDGLGVLSGAGAIVE